MTPKPVCSTKLPFSIEICSQSCKKICMTLLDPQMADLLFYVKLNILYMSGAL